MKNAAGLSTEDADLLVLGELALAGIEPIAVPVQGEVRASVGGDISVGGYVIRLRRAWVYWSAVVAAMPNPPEDRVPRLPAPLARRGGQDSSELGDGVTCWHIDTQEGLNAFAKWIKENLR